MANLHGPSPTKGLIPALGGGGVRGFAHLGALRALREAGLPIAGVAGSSAGAYAAASLALGLPLAVAPLIEHVIDRDLANLFLANGNRLLRAARVQSRLFKALRRTAIDDAKRLREGLLTFYGDVHIEDAGVPLAINAADLHTGEVVVLKKGPLVKALMASSAIPGIFPPVEWRGRLLVDGDVVEKVPVTAARELGGDPIVGIDVSNPRRNNRPRNSFEVMLMAGEASINRLKELALDRADFVLSLTPKQPVDTFDYSQARLLFSFGYEQTRKSIPVLQGLLAPKRRGLLVWLQKISGRSQHQTQ